jgi:tRNA A58 N-methylase Trm61
MMIKYMYDNVLLKWWVDPAGLLKELGLKAGQRVFEVGCGPVFYKAGAAAAVGNLGDVIAYDVNLYAVQYTRKKLKRLGITNARVR